MNDLNQLSNIELLSLYETTKMEVARYNNLQGAVKVGLNSSYGATGSAYFRFYDVRLAQAVTLAGQLSIRWIHNKLNEYLNGILNTKDFDYIIYVDTDSVSINFEPLVKKVFRDKKPTDIEIIDFLDKICSEKVKKFIDDSYSELAKYVNTSTQRMNMKREKICSTGIYTGKKRYLLNVYDNEGVRYSTPELSITGLEMIKSSTPIIIREKLKEVTNLIINGTESDVQTYIANFREEFNKLPPEDIAFPRSVNSIKEYSDSVSLYKKGTPINAKGAILHNHLIDKLKLNTKYQKISSGDKIKFIYLKEPNILKDKVIAFSGVLPKEFGLHEYIDRELMFEKVFLDSIDIILKCIGWKAEKTNSLNMFFD